MAKSFKKPQGIDAFFPGRSGAEVAETKAPEAPAPEVIRAPGPVEVVEPVVSEEVPVQEPADKSKKLQEYEPITFRLKKRHLTIIRAIAHHERTSITEVVNELVRTFAESQGEEYIDRVLDGYVNRRRFGRR